MTPLTKSGKYQVETKPVEANGPTIVVKASDDLLGYEEDFYEVKPALEEGVTIRFQSATAHMVDGTSASRQQPLWRLPQFPVSTTYIRLLFLTRESQTDYDGAILAAASLPQLDTLARHVEDDPALGCTIGEQSICRWIPLGISVQPQPNTPRK